MALSLWSITKLGVGLICGLSGGLGVGGVEARPEPQAAACYTQRAEDASVSARAPVQALRLRFVRNMGGLYIDVAGEMGARGQAGGALRQRVFCANFAQGTTCRAECDAGGLTLRKVGGNMIEIETQRLRLEGGAQGGARTGGCAGGRDLAATGRSTIYRLYRQPGALCASRD